MSLFTAKAKTFPEISAFPTAVTVNLDTFVSGFWNPKGDEFVGQFGNGMAYAYKSQDALTMLSVLTERFGKAGDAKPATP